MSRVVRGTAGKVLIGSTEGAVINHFEFTIAAESTHEGVFGAGGKKKAWTGQEALTGTVRGKYDRDQPAEAWAVVGNTQLTLKLYDDVTEDATAFWSVPCKFTSLAVTHDGVTGNPTEFTASFINDGAWTEPSRS